MQVPPAGHARCVTVPASYRVYGTEVGATDIPTATVRPLPVG